MGDFGGWTFVVSADLYRHEENEGDEDLKAEFLCPFCAEDFDVVGLCCHIDEEHPVEAKNGVCSFLLFWLEFNRKIFNFGCVCFFEKLVISAFLFLMITSENVTFCY